MGKQISLFQLSLRHRQDGMHSKIFYMVIPVHCSAWLKQGSEQQPDVSVGTGEHCRSFGSPVRQTFFCAKKRQEGHGADKQRKLQMRPKKGKCIPEEGQ